MPTCNACGADHAAADLERHVVEGTLTVHCPECDFVMGRYRDPGLEDA